eukprot:621635-Prorocentrum_minimum.AAC.1
MGPRPGTNVLDGCAPHVLVNLRGCRWTECEEKTLLGFPIGEKRSYFPWLVIASVYYATPFVYVRNSGLGP